jgi:meso-butanediol dehydrogenase/(S,S)-butanediol dehydrogenase/diacetyl reductase
VFIADVSKREQVVAAVEHAHQTLGGFDIIVNNAGVAQIDSLLDVSRNRSNAPWASTCRACCGASAAGKKFKALKQKGQDHQCLFHRRARGFALLGVYSATKFAVRALTQAAARGGERRVTVNAYCPGVVGTDMWVEIDKRMAEITGAEVGRPTRSMWTASPWAAPKRRRIVAGLVAFLAGPDADYITGQSPLIDGGLVYR